ncbi:Do family serine endopeptidase [Hirschia baltica]|uniref:Probable periplasmic serine endoprotease DegP-like n=1 Tax=Hirschia baltica (strain ATCC 49814 / DSM 5838 / IFAM 1418) TaxID=582402 RepID=C6XIM4_HIRBI|nr:Do family serine endopeptidase [Hirschia baltica]ACT58969.1 protease Do [Hirschia baltica ATCC 49814]
MKTTGKSRTLKMSLAMALLGSAAVGGLILSPVGSKIADAKPIVVQAPVGAPLSFADLIEKVNPAVVTVQVTTEIEAPEQYGELFERFRNIPGFDDFMDRQGRGEGEEGESEEDEGPAPREGRSLGSGFFISDTGYIVTNNHVVENASEVTITLSNGDELEAEIIGLDELTDLAVLKVKEGGKYPYVEFELGAPPRVGDWVVAVGNPFGLGGTATAGIVSAISREMNGSNYSNYIQVDASINRGNSGGPTFDLYGKVIGVNTAIYSPSGGSVGIGFAIESTVAKEITDILIKDGKVTRGWLGVSIQSMTVEMAESQGLKNEKGALVADVQVGSPAEKGGIERGDVILSVNGLAVKDSRELTRLVGGLIAESKNEFKLIRDGKEKTVSVTVGVRPSDVDSAFNRGGSESEGEKEDEVAPEGALVHGLTVKPLSKPEFELFGLKENENGVLVLDLNRNSAFAEAGIAKGDALLEAQGTTLKSADDLASVIKNAKKEGKKNILVAVRKGRATIFLPVEIEDLK